jgi:nitrite reductase/ring-hydroxylating ferredoxin subunit
MGWQRVARSADVVRVLRRFQVREQPVLLGRTAAGDAIAVQPICPHQNRPMDGANIFADEIDCPHHHYTYDARTGENRYPKRVFPRSRAEQVRSINAFATKEEDGWVWVWDAFEPRGSGRPAHCASGP